MTEKLEMNLEQNSPYRVALELAYTIAKTEGKVLSGDRKYWLDLYQRCRSVVVVGKTATYALEQPD